jgi:hypothetical protein
MDISRYQHISAVCMVSESACDSHCCWAEGFEETRVHRVETTVWKHAGILKLVRWVWHWMWNARLLSRFANNDAQGDRFALWNVSLLSNRKKDPNGCAVWSAYYVDCSNTEVTASNQTLAIDMWTTVFPSIHGSTPFCFRIILITNFSCLVAHVLSKPIPASTAFIRFKK